MKKPEYYSIYGLLLLEGPMAARWAKAHLKSGTTQISDAMAELKSDGLVERIGRGRNTKWKAVTTEPCVTIHP